MTNHHDDEAVVPLLDGQRQSERPPPQNPEIETGAASSRPSPSAPSLADLDAPSAPPIAPADSASQPRRKLRRETSADSSRKGVISSAGASFVSFVDEYYPEGSLKGSIFNLCSATLGAGCLSVPFAFRGMGIATGVVLLMLVAYATSFSVHLIIETRVRTGFRSYGEIADGVFGKMMGRLLELCVVIFCFGTSVAYCKTLRDILDPVLDVLPHNWTRGITDQHAMIALWTVFLLPLSCLRSMSALRFSSLFGVASIVYVAGCVSVHAVINLINGKIAPKWSQPTLWLVPNINQVTLNLPILLFAFTCQVNVLDVWDDLSGATPPRMAKVTFRSMLLCIVIYVLVGLFGFLEFGRHTCGNILKSYEAELLEGSWMIIAMYIFIALTLIFAYPLVILPCRASIISLFSSTIGISGGHYFWTIAIAGGSVAISLWVDDVSQVFQLVGASSSALVCFVFPSAAAIRCGIVSGRDKFLAWLLLIGGITVGVLGTYVTLKDIYNPSADDTKCV